MVEIAESWSGPWQILGKGSGTTRFDVSNAKIKQFRYLRITDDGDGFTGVAEAGFDLDAVDALLVPENSAYLMAANHTIIDTLSNFNGILEAGEITGINWEIENLGDLTAHEVAIEISSASRYIEILTDTASLVSVGDGAISVTDGLKIRAMPTTPHQTAVPLEVRINAADKEWEHLINLDISGGAVIESADTELTFNEVFLHVTESAPLLVRNSGKDTLKVFQARAATASFWVEDQQMLIPPGQEKELTVYYRPQSPKVHNDTLTILNNDPQNTRFLIALSGKGASLPSLGLSEDSIAANIGIDDSLSITIDIRNEGAGDLEFQMTLLEVNVRGEGRPGFAYPIGAVQHLVLPEEDQSAEAGRDRQRIDFDDSRGLSEKLELPFYFPFLGAGYPSLRVDRNGRLLLQPEADAGVGAIADTILQPQIMPLFAAYEHSSSATVSFAYRTDQFSVRWQGLERPGYDGGYDIEARLSASGNIEFLYHQVAGIDTGLP